MCDVATTRRSCVCVTGNETEAEPCGSPEMCDGLKLCRQDWKKQKMKTETKQPLKLF